MDLFEILCNDERVVVYSNSDDHTIITWNQSLTLQLYKDKLYNANVKPNDYEFQHTTEFEELDVRTLDHEPMSFAQARREALRWVDYLNE